MLRNYYEILGVVTNASPDQILEAYRQAALKNHPDRGGSHEAMVLVNEAWTILSDPQTRSYYDQVRNGQSITEADWLQETAEVRKTAGRYPKEWKAFEKWLNGIAADLEATKFERSFCGPSSFNSVSGAICTAGGLFLVMAIGYGTGIAESSFYTSLGVTQQFLCAAVVGGWLGYGIHSFLRKAVAAMTSSQQCMHPNPSSAPISDSKFEILSCPACGQRLRVPRIDGKLEVTCAGCRRRFSHKSTFKNR